MGNLNNCQACGKYLGPDDYDGICCECDEKDEWEQKIKQRGEEVLEFCIGRVASWQHEAMSNKRKAVSYERFIRQAYKEKYGEDIHNKTA